MQVGDNYISNSDSSKILPFYRVIYRVILCMVLNMEAWQEILQKIAGPFLCFF